jgi:hypothetical protein
MDCDFLEAWSKALDSVKELGTAQSVYVQLEDHSKHKDSDGDDTYGIYRRSQLTKCKKTKRGKMEGD